MRAVRREARSPASRRCADAFNSTQTCRRLRGLMKTYRRVLELLQVERRVLGDPAACR